MFKKLRFAPLVAVFVIFADASLAAKEVPVEDFFKRSGFSNFQLSPDGTHLAAITPINNRRNIAVIDLKTRKAKAITGVKERDISGFGQGRQRILRYLRHQ
jgi:hypothetical protein